MGGLIVILGLGWLAYQLIKDACIKPVHPDSDFRQALIDLSNGKCTPKEMDKRMVNGYYAKKEEDQSK